MNESRRTKGRKGNSGGSEYRGLIMLALASMISVTTLGGCATGGGKPEEKETVTEVPTKGSATSERKPIIEVPKGTEKGMEDVERVEEGREGSVNKKKEVEVELVSLAVELAIDEAVEKFRKGDPDGAVTVLERVYEDPSGGALALYNAGVIRERQGRQEDAWLNYLAALEKNNSLSLALDAFVKSSIQAGKLEEAERVARAYVNLAPNSTGHRVALARIDITRKKYEDVIAVMNRLLRREERNIDVMEMLAVANNALKRHELAKAIIKRAIELEPNRASLYAVYANASMDMGNETEARVNLEKAVSLDADFPEAQNNLGYLYHRARDNEEAVKHLLAAIKTFPNYVEAHLNLGHAYKELQRYEEAEKSYQEVVRLDSTYVDGYYSLGTLYLEAKMPNIPDIARLKKSIEMLERVKSLEGDKKDDPVDKYLLEAKKQISEKEEMMRLQREQQQEAEKAETEAKEEGGEAKEEGAETGSEPEAN